MAEYERSRTMAALPEQVFEQAADLDRLNSWLPNALHVHVEDPPAVTVHDDHDEQDTSALLSARPEQMRLEWGTRNEGYYAGWLQVAGIGSGASEVTVHLSFFDEHHDPGERSVQEALDASLRNLQEQVRLRVENTAG